MTRLVARVRSVRGAESYKPPHVLLVVENVALARDHRLQKQVSALSGSGYRVTVICRADPRNHRFGVRVQEYPAPPEATSRLGFVREYAYSWVMAAWLVLKLFLVDRFEAIQISGTPDIYFAIGAPFKLLGRRLVLDQRDLSPELYATRYGHRSGIVYRALCRLEKISYRTADHVITVNSSLQSTVQSRGGLSPAKVTVVGNGPVIARAWKRPPRMELKHGKRFLCCWLGFMGPQDRVDLAVRAIDRVVHVIGRTDCHFAFIGDGETRRTCEKLAADLGLTEWISFPGWADQEEAFAYLSTADIGLEPNLEEIVSPVKAMEYMAFGLPLVAFDLKETRALAGAAAVYAAPGDIAGFARLIDRLLDESPLRGMMGRMGRQIVEERLAWERQEGAYLQIYDDFLRRPHHQKPSIIRPERTLERV
jgi:glycosyltransferase involved in cell wall biosynthesis